MSLDAARTSACATLLSEDPANADYGSVESALKELILLWAGAEAEVLSTKD